MSENNSPAVTDPIAVYKEGCKGMNDNTLSNHLSVARQLSEWLGDERTVLDAGRVDIRDWLLNLDDNGYAGSTIKQYHAYLKSFYSEFVDDGGDNEDEIIPSVINSNPAKLNFDKHLSSVTTTAKKQQMADNDEGIIHLDPEEVQKLRKHVASPKVRNELIIKMLVQTGMRATELANLTCSRLKRENQVVEVTDTKNDTARTVPYDDLDPELSLWLDEGYRAELTNNEDNDYVFPTNESKHITEEHIGRIVRDAADRADIQDKWGEDAAGRKKRRITAHSLRSTFVMRLFKSGVSTPQIQKMTGHTNLDTLDKYAKAARQDAIESYRDADIEFGT